MGALVKHARLVAEADAPADEEVPVGIVVKVVVHNPREAQYHVTEEGRVLHYLRESWREDPDEWPGQTSFSCLPGHPSHPSGNRSPLSLHQRRELCPLSAGADHVCSAC